MRGYEKFTHFGGIKQRKSMVLFGDFPDNRALFGLVMMMKAGNAQSMMMAGKKETYNAYD